MGGGSLGGGGVGFGIGGHPSFRTSGLLQYCSLNNLNTLGEIDPASALPLMWPDWIVAHFSLHAARIQAMAAGAAAFLKDFVEDRLMKNFSVLRGK